MREEHEAEALYIRDIEHITHGLSLPQGACNS
jgi:regulator of cell morphogenesis and NO signaling